MKEKFFVFNFTGKCSFFNWSTDGENIQNVDLGRSKWKNKKNECNMGNPFIEIFRIYTLMTDSFGLKESRLLVETEL